jgi:hypothetical protein
MELECVETYSAPDYSLQPGQTTDGLDLPEQEKERLLSDYPEKFKQISGKGLAAETKVPEIESKEAGDSPLKAEKRKGK